MKVKLIAHTPEPEKVIAMAAKLCYSSSDIDTLEESLTDEKIQSFLNMLMDLGHESPVEHVSFTFAIEGISRSCSHQLVRHRIASYSQKSQRYVNESQFEYITPPSVLQDRDVQITYDDIMSRLQKDYDDLRNVLTTIHQSNLISDGVNPEDAYKKAQKLANEDARFILPNACETKIVVTMNIRSLYNFFKHRMCNRAQWEINRLAWAMWEECLKVSKTLFKNAGPSCINGKCPEGKMSCGKMSEVKSMHDFELDKERFFKELDERDAYYYKTLNDVNGDEE